LKYPLVAFDFDGTLADSFPWFLKVLNVAAEKFHFKKVAPHELEALRGLDNRQIIKALGVPMWKLPAIAKEMRAMAAKDKIPLFAGSAHLLAQLKANGHTLAIVTSNSRENVEAVLEESKKLIDHWECGASLFGKKSKLKKLLKKAGFHAGQSIYIGDELRDIDAAKESGMAAGAVGWGYALPAALLERKPDLYFSEMSEIPLKVL
jgi:phosphoglycolate phosphatase